MTDINYKNRGSVLNPIRSIQFLGRESITEPLEPRLASDNYRGFHLNDWDLCVGCSTCQKVCDNAAITMVAVPGLEDDPVKGIRNHRPAIDYGRCCWCGLCVDICPTSSLSLSREYVHTCTQDEIDSYFILPDPKGMHQQFFGEGWKKDSDSDLLNLDRQDMREVEPESRSDNFDEIVEGFDLQQAVAEASRCVQCGMCHDACPTHMHAPEYIRAIWEQDFEEAVRQIYRSNPFSNVCGRVCTHRCEDACSIGNRGDAVAIRWLKRFAMDAVDLDRIKSIAAEMKVDEANGKRVAIVGAGPAGLTAAYDLAKLGYQVQVFEALSGPGGMTRFGIPEYRLPFDKIDEDVEVIQSLGVNIQYNTRVGEDITLNRLHQEYDAVLMAIGLQLGRSTRVPGSEHQSVKKAVDLLQKIRSGETFDVPKSAVVIGGGNVAMDIARSIVRLQNQQYGQINMTVTALEDKDHFLADPVEIKEAIEEGIVILDSRGPQNCVIDDTGQMKGLKTWRVLSIFDEQHRFAPQYDQQDEMLHEAEMVIEAIGQMSDVTLLSEDLTESLEWNRGRLSVDANGQTALDWLWAAGDSVNGPDVVHAVADGHRVAASIHQNLQAEATQ